MNWPVMTWYGETYAPLELMRWRCGNCEMVEDVLQETWMVAVQKLRRFRPETGSFQGWLCGIAANVIRNTLRQKRRGEFYHQSCNKEIPANGSGAMEEQERSESIARALDCLPVRYEQVLRAKYLDQYSVAAIATLWGETEKAIESLLTRAHRLSGCF